MVCRGSEISEGKGEVLLLESRVTWNQNDGIEKVSLTRITRYYLHTHTPAESPI